ncbi:f774c5d9-156b-42f2-a98a-c3c4e9949a12 [Thermothielavioides terrestris]|uniref:F774c5d9-156b-42f2-a98a-c3c4e9949a12 n=1 Tax=Thermothielavioides terrestris TaxID=2587410 RepID=A0A446B721_9PEZI|nr:f774c5d9-156b-42f2-a98a-c3c4e9949a12 [Thermothielavioides terrestris]
MAFLDYLI